MNSEMRVNHKFQTLEKLQQKFPNLGSPNWGFLIKLPNIGKSSAKVSKHWKSKLGLFNKTSKHWKFLSKSFQTLEILPRNRSLAFYALLSIITCVASTASAYKDIELGFIASRVYETNGIVRTRGLGPFWEHAKLENGPELKAVRPFWSKATIPGRQVEYVDILWPLYSRADLRTDTSWLCLLSHHQSSEDESRDHFWIVPFFFTGHDKDGNKYLALFPLGGELREFLGRDWIKFCLFPLYGRSSVSDVETLSILWPIYSRTEGEGISRFRIFPFYGRSKFKDDYKKKFIMWPFWTQAEYYHPGASGSGFIFFPFWGHLKLEDQESWMFLPPFFRFHKGEKLNLTYAPWPFFQKTSGEVEKLFIWPLWGYRRFEDLYSSFYLWPICWFSKSEVNNERRSGFLLLPLIHSYAVTDTSEETETVTSRYFKLWPLFKYRRSGVQREYRILALFPFKDFRGVRQNWEPFWTLANRRTDGILSETEILWGLYRRKAWADGYRYNSIFPFFSWQIDRRKEIKEWSLLKGLLGYNRHKDKWNLRLLYFFKFGAEELD